ncbi:EAL and HDOD domain-containing protein [Cellulomonas triticagri]|uniref:HDOD domain-containing protein n=1 Tax=Cellulomonas triticagri TaxID=2483352 RepID=A0A3M2J8F4_9CELL|nr:HDOD domain-containing protein [Cellulomonas triticagri]RMI06768.1 HDOD domain-containing protein [Cellulomonas triticagri]
MTSTLPAGPGSGTPAPRAASGSPIPIGGGEATVQRQPVVLADRSVHGYAVRVLISGPTGAPLPDESTEAAVEAAYRRLDLPGLAGDKPVLLRGTSGILSGSAAVWYDAEKLVLEITPALARRDDLDTLLAAASVRGSRFALADYDGSAAQDRLLDRVAYVKIDLRRGDAQLADLVARAHAAGARVVAEHTDSTERVDLASGLGADLMQGPMFHREPPVVRRQFSAGELQCLELLRVLSEETVDQQTVVRTVATDPELSMRVLHLVNSSAFGLRREIDSVLQAVVLVGPRQLHALAIASLIDAKPSSVQVLWSILTRAQTCHALSHDDAGYTAGLLSAVASYQGLDLTDLVTRAGVSEQLGAAVLRHEGPLGQVLAAVLAHEENDTAGVTAAGLEPWDVAHAYLAAVPSALATATALAFGD